MGKYNILNLAKGTLLKATHVKHIEDGVFDAHNELNQVNEKTVAIDERLKKIEETNPSDNSVFDLAYTEI